MKLNYYQNEMRKRSEKEIKAVIAYLLLSLFKKLISYGTQKDTMQLTKIYLRENDVLKFRIRYIYFC